MLPKINPTLTKAWKELEAHAEFVSDKHLLQLFQEIPDRAANYQLSTDQIWLDFSKNHIDQKALDLLYSLADECKLQDGIEAMYAGLPINETEKRAVLHVALRNRANTPITDTEDQNVMPKVNTELAKMESFVEKLHQNKLLGYSGKSLDTVVNIGIGGSDLGPAMVVKALTPFKQSGIKSHFVSNIDGAQLTDVLNTIDPESTLFIIASKSFTTAETMTNARSARQWMLDQGMPNAAVKNHFVAVSTNGPGVSEFGIAAENMFVFWDWVGGRFSLSSAIGLSIMCAIGPMHFYALLEGMHEMDLHFRLSPPNKNLPITLALISIWYANFFGVEAEALLPYIQHLELLPAYMQQAFMESNGKSVDRNGEVVEYDTETIIWGEPGTNGQHAFYQLLHQGTRLVPCDFIMAAKAQHNLQVHQDMLNANCIAQAEALMCGFTEDQVIDQLNAKGMTEEEIDFHTPFRVFEGNRPSNLIMLKALDPKALGSLIALYEHKIMVKGLIWNIFSYDQWGVQLGKVLAKDILEEINAGQINGHDSSTQAILTQYLQWR